MDSIRFFSFIFLVFISLSHLVRSTLIVNKNNNWGWPKERDEMRFNSNISCIIFIIFVFVPTCVQSSPLEEAVSLYQYGEFQKSYQALQTPSLENNAQAFFLLGKMHERGDGVRRDESKAIKFYQKAADLGFGAAVQRIDLLRNGENSIVLDWYLESAWDGDIESVFNLGYLYESGMGVRIDETRALRWYEEAAGQLHADAQLRLGLMLIAGAGIKDDVNSGRQWILKAASNGNKVAKMLKSVFLKNYKSPDIVKLVKGLRTLDHSDEVTMLRVLSFSVEQMSQPSSLRLLDEPTVLIGEGADNDLVSNVPLINQMEKERSKKSTDQLPLKIPRQSESNVLLWIALSIVLTGILTTLIHFLFRKRTAVVSTPEWKDNQQLVLPELEIGSSDREFFKKMLGKEKQISMPDNFPILVEEPIEVEPLSYSEEEISPPIASEEQLLVKSRVEDDLRRPAKISYDDLVPRRVVDLQMSPVVDHSEELLLQKEINQREIEPSEVSVEHSAIQEKPLVNIRQTHQSSSYVSQQTREFEASQSNNSDELSEARLNIGLMFLHGDGVVANIPLAIKWLKRSMEHGNIIAEAELTQLYVNYPEYVEVDEAEQRFSA